MTPAYIVARLRVMDWWDDAVTVAKEAADLIESQQREYDSLLTSWAECKNARDEWIIQYDLLQAQIAVKDKAIKELIEYIQNDSEWPHYLIMRCRAALSNAECGKDGG